MKYTLLLLSGCLLLSACSMPRHSGVCEGSFVKGCQPEVYFPFDSAKMRIDEEKKLSWPIQKLKRFPDRQVVISGYTDQIGSDKYNLALSCRRAETVKAYFIEQGISADRITTECKGKAEPRVTCCQVEPATTQRRAEIKIESRSNLF